MDSSRRPTFFRHAVACAFGLTFAIACAQAETLTLPDRLDGFASDAGQRDFAESEARTAYFPLASNFVTQKTQAFCGVASIVMVLNSMNLPAPAVPEYDPYRTFTQDNVLDDKTEAVLPRAVLDRIGMTLDQIGGILATKAVTATVVHAGDSNVEDFRRLASAHLGEAGHFVLVNYLRKAIGQERGGHISPLGAYDAKTDRFLILDVARYKYPPVWVTAADLFAAMNTQDSDNADKSRGFVLVSATPTQ